MDAYQLKPWTQVATPHDDILRGELEMSTYAADLWAVVRDDPRCPKVYRDPQDFFEATYLTTALKKLLRDVLQVLGGGAGDRVLQLRTPFGGGKTHTLIALYHLATARNVLTDLEELPDPGPVRVAVLHGLELDPHVGHRPKDGPHLHTLWGELAWQLGGTEAYELVRAQDEGRTAPGGDVVRQLLSDGPTLILIDEALVYVQKAMAIPLHDSTLGRQVMVFLQTLTEVVRGLPQAAMVYSLQASVHEATGEEALLQDLDHLVSRVDAKREPVSGDEVTCVVQRRLFKDLGEEAVRQAVARAYAMLYQRLREGLGQTESERREAAHEAEVLQERILKSYPFHPDLLDLMYHRWGSLPSYQRTRGALQFLATNVYALWHNPQTAQPLIGPGDVLVGDEAARGTFFSQVGEREHNTASLGAPLARRGEAVGALSGHPRGHGRLLAQTGTGPVCALQWPLDHYRDRITVIAEPVVRYAAADRASGGGFGGAAERGSAGAGVSGGVVGVANIPEMIKSTLKEIIARRRDVMILAARQRAKFEGWLKFELAAALSTRNGIQSVDLETQYITGGKSDLSFKVDGITWYIEMKTANVSWRADGLESKTRPITRNVSGIIDDIAKLCEKCPPSRGLMVFTLFPVPTRIWDHERERLDYHLRRIERESGLAKNTLMRNSDFVVLDKQFGVALFVVKAI